METLKKYESFEKTFNIKPDDRMSEPEFSEYKTQPKKKRGVKVRRNRILKEKNRQDL